MSVRLATANTYDNTMANLTARQAELAQLQEQLSSGKRVIRPSDDPTNAAQAERAMNRLSRIDVEMRALNLQRNAMAIGESTLGDATAALQSIRDLLLSAGNPSFNKTNLSSVAEQMRSLRDQLFAFANKKDSNGVPIFGGLGSASEAFTQDANGNVITQFNPGQATSSEVSIASVLDGQAVWMSVPVGNGVFKVNADMTNNTGTVWTDSGTVTDPRLASDALSPPNSPPYTLRFSVVGNVTTYDILDSGSNVLTTGQPYTSGHDIAWSGMSFKVSGQPADQDKILLEPSGAPIDLFQVIDDAIRGLTQSAGGGTLGNHELAQNYTLALTQLDAGMDRVQSARGFAGELLRRADNVETTQTATEHQVQADRSRAEDIDMVKGISEFQNRQTGYDAAIRTYAQVQRLSLFNYLG